MTKAAHIVSELRKQAVPSNLPGMARYGINTKRALGVSIPKLRSIARRAGPDHSLALKLWATGIHEARILAGMVDDPHRVTSAQMDRWARDFDSWDVCDQACSNLFTRTRHAHRKAAAWSRRKDEFVKRAGFTLMAALAVHDKTAGNAAFQRFLVAIRRQAVDERNYVKKAVNWALRQIGKRNRVLNKSAIHTARRLHGLPSRSALWIASDALRELTSRAVRRRLRKRHDS